MAVAACVNIAAFADVVSEQTLVEESDFVSDEKLEEGYLTHYVNEAIASGMSAIDSKSDVEYGRKVIQFVSAPKVGGYFIGKYSYDDQDGKTTNGGFSQRLVRFYIDGTILNDFAYRIQMQTNNDKFHMKDFFVEWKKYSEFKVKIGQFKRAFGFENPMNPWDVGDGDYSQLTKKMTGHNDFLGAESSSNGGRDQGIQFQGDLFPVGKDKHNLLHYQLMIANGQGINVADANKKKDIIGTIQVQPVKGLFLGFFGWTGDYTSNNLTVDRNRYMLSAKYDANDWTFRAEYAHSTGHKISDYVNGEWTGKGKADAWYATVGIPCTNWLKTYVKYDVYRDDATSDTQKSMFIICPNIQLHKNLMFQVQYNYVYDKMAKCDKHYNELWLETYVRF